ncbi:Abi family protein [Thiolapillus sp.]
MSYPKPPTTVSDQIELLARRGMRISEDAAHYLTHIGYYRLRGYWIPFEEANPPEGDHRFRAATSFDDILNLYIFDRELKLLVTDAIERIEVSVRNQWVDVLAQEHGAHAYLKSELFRSQRQFGRCLSELSSEYDRSKETHIKHYKKKYGEPDLPPIWAAVDIMTLGQFSHWLSNLKPKALKSRIAKTYGLDEDVLCSFLHHLTIIRNICAHHGRLWNRSMTITMKLPRSKPAELNGVIDRGPDPNQAPRKLYNTLVMMAWFLDCISPEHHFRQRLMGLIDTHGIQATAMGFPSDWRESKFWMENIQ